MDDTLFLKKTAEVFSISETSVRRYVKMCIDKKLIEVSNKNQCGYRLVTYEKKWSVSNDGTLEEDQIFLCRDFTGTEGNFEKCRRYMGIYIWLKS